MTVPGSARRAKVRELGARTFSSLRVRNYRLYFTGQLTSVSGTWTQWVAQSWLIVETLGGNGLELGAVMALQCGPMLIAGLWGGLIADRFDKRTLLRWGNALQALFSATLAVLALSGVINIWEVYVFAFLSGSVTVVDMPTRQAFVMELVGPTEIPNAVGLNSALLNGGRLVGPPVAAVLITLFDGNTGPAFIVNAVSFVVAFLMLSLMDPGALHPAVQASRSSGQVREGIRFMFRTPVLRDTLILIAALTMFGFNFVVVLPLLAKFVFHGGPGIYALLSSVMAVGSILGALATASRRRPSMAFLAVAAIAFGLLSVLAGVAPSLPIEVLILAGLGLASMGFMATANATLQLNSPRTMRGRVMSAYALLIVGGNTVGAPIIGWVAETFGPRAALVAGGSATLVVASAVWYRRRRVAGPPFARAGEIAPPATAAPLPESAVLGEQSP